MDLENKLTRAQIENIQLRGGVRTVNEVRTDYGLEPVDWGDEPLTYNGLNDETKSESEGEVKMLKKALFMERIKDEYND